MSSPTHLPGLHQVKILWEGGSGPTPQTVSWLYTGDDPGPADRFEAALRWGNQLLFTDGADWRDNYPAQITPVVVITEWTPSGQIHTATADEWNGFGISDCGPGSLSWNISLYLGQGAAGALPGRRRVKGRMRLPFVATDVRENGVSNRLYGPPYPGLVESLDAFYAGVHSFTTAGGALWQWVVPTLALQPGGEAEWCHRYVVGLHLEVECASVLRRRAMEFGQH